MIEQPTHEVEINCPVAQIPEELVVNLLHLELGQSITAGDIPLPEGATLITSADAVIVSCYLPTAAPEVEAVAAAEGEPELVGRKPAEEAESES
jgi:large subunit ribosomal protein L25